MSLQYEQNAWKQYVKELNSGNFSLNQLCNKGYLK